MSEIAIGVNDHEAAAEIMTRSYELLETMALLGLAEPGNKNRRQYTARKPATKRRTP